MNVKKFKSREKEFPPIDKNGWKKIKMVSSSRRLANSVKVYSLPPFLCMLLLNWWNSHLPKKYYSFEAYFWRRLLFRANNAAFNLTSGIEEILEPSARPCWTLGGKDFGWIVKTVFLRMQWNVFGVSKFHPKHERTSVKGECNWHTRGKRPSRWLDDYMSMN